MASSLAKIYVVYDVDDTGVYLTNFIKVNNSSKMPIYNNSYINTYNPNIHSVLYKPTDQTLNEIFSKVKNNN